MKKHFTTTLITTLVVLFVSCNKPDDKPESFIYDFSLIVLNEGTWNGNNASITLYDSKTREVSQDVFFKQNGRNLGDLANDILIYGGKIYISVGGSSTLEITDLNLKSLSQISFDGVAIDALEPQGLAAYNGNVYIVCFDGKLARLDTLTLKVNNIIPVGRNPQNIVINNGFAYITNSGGLDFPNYDNTVSVVDLATFTEVKKIGVGDNPFSIGVDENGDIIVGCRWDYSQFSLHRIHATTHDVHTFNDVFVSDFAMRKSTIYFYNVAYDPKTWEVLGTEYTAFNTLTGQTRSLINKPSVITSPYAINVNHQTESVYISDAIDYKNSGRAFGFDKNGVKLFEFTTGISPKKIVVLK